MGKIELRMYKQSDVKIRLSRTVQTIYNIEVAEEQYSCINSDSGSIPARAHFLQNGILHVQALICQISFCLPAVEMSEFSLSSEIQLRLKHMCACIVSSQTSEE